MRKLNVFLFALFACFPLFAEGDFRAYSTDRAFQPVRQDVDVLNIKCEAFIDGPKNYIDASATITFRTFYRPTDSIQIRTANLNVKEVTLDGRAVDYDFRGGEMLVRPGVDLPYNSEHDLVIKYDAYPFGGLHFTGWQENEKHKRKQIWAHSFQNWCPYHNVKQDIMTSEVIITFDEKYKVFSNGPLVSEVNNDDGTKTWHYKMTKPHVVYLACLMIGDFGVRKFKTERGLDLEYLYYKDMADRFDVAYKYSKEMFAFFEEETGILYPWELYRNMPAADYLFGGMEATTSTVFGDYMYVDERAWWMRNYVNVNAHELAHQWFGNYVSNIRKEIWLAESFPTYYAKIFEKSVFGEDYYQWVRDQEFDLTFEAAARNNLPVQNSGGGRGRYYMKGSLVLDMMRDYLGDEGFKAAIEHYLKENAHKVVSYDDFLRAIREATGESMEWFFDQWIMRGGEPHYQIEYSALKDKSGRPLTQIDVRQIHKTGNLVDYFRMPIEIRVYYTDGSYNSAKPWIDGAYTKVEIPNQSGKEIEFVLFDPGRHIIKKMTFDRSLEELSAQAVKAPNMIDRLEAVRSMKKIDLDKKLDIFEKAFDRNMYHLVRGEIIRQIIGEPNYKQSGSALGIIRKALHSGDERVIRSVVEATDYVPDKLRKDFEKTLSDSCYRNVELALDDLCRSFPKRTGKYLKETRDEVGWRGRNIRVKRLEIAVDAGRKKHLKELIDYSSTNYDFETRINAYQALERLNYCDPEVAENLFEGILYWHYKVNRAAKPIIRHFYRQREYKAIFDEIIKSDTFTEEEKQKLRRVL